jgi:hypothetical protein
VAGIQERVTYIQTGCASCGSEGITIWEYPPGWSIEDYLASLRARCPDCAAASRSATALDGPPDLEAHPTLAGPWSDILEFMARNGTATTVGTVGRNDRCPCGSGRKFKRCCG